MKFNYFKLNPVAAGLYLALLTGSGIAVSAPSIQCPGDWDGDGVVNWRENGNNPPAHLANVKCMHLSAGDSFINTADGINTLYTFGFGELTGLTDTDPATAKPDPIAAGRLNAEFPGRAIVMDEGDEMYLTLTNVSTVKRPDLFDPHTVHYHGFPNASSFWDGVPENTVSINQGASFTYYYKNVEPGTYMYHCHVEATEHMEMGMLGNLYVHSAQDKLPDGTLLKAHLHSTGDRYAYNDGDGSTAYDLDVPLQLGGMDFDFHDDHINVQPLPFSTLDVDYPMINGRGYPDTVKSDGYYDTVTNHGLAQLENEGKNSQPLGSLITAKVGDKILLRTSNLNITRFFTLTAQGLTMEVVGQGARLMRGPNVYDSTTGTLVSVGKDTRYKTNSVTLGGGEAMDVMIDTTGVAPGTYFVYTTNLNYLSNNDEDYGGMMTEIVINPAAI